MTHLTIVPDEELDPRQWTEAERANVQLIVDGYRALVAGASDEAVAAIYAPGYRDHASTVPGGDLAALTAMVRGSQVEYPDTEIVLERLVADGDLVVVASRGRRAADGDWDHIMEIFRVAGSRVAEHWEVIEPAGFFAAIVGDGE